MTDDMHRFVGHFGHAVVGIAGVSLVVLLTINYHEAIFIFCCSSASVLFIGLVCELIIWRLKIRAKRKLNVKYGRIGEHPKRN